MSPLVKKILMVLVYIFAAIGFVLVVGYFAVKLGLTNTSGIIDTQRDSFLSGGQTNPAPASLPVPQAWANTEEWSVIESATRKDADIINRAAGASGVPARLIVADLVTEQLRLFFTEREFYKQFFYPLKILGSQTQFSWGVMGMKEDTAIQVEQHLVDSTSPYYLGPAYEHALDFPAGTIDIQQARFARMTDQHNHYYSYLYAGLFLKQIEAQWTQAGFPIDTKPEILSTLFNIGFTHSVPNANPQVGGAAITLDGVKSFGTVAAEFYNSDLMIDVFPR